MVEHLTNRVFRAVEGRATGLLPLLPAELVVTLGTALAGAAAVHLFVGLALGGACAALLVAWRRKHRGRADYVHVTLRGLRAPQGTYPRHARDRRAQPFERE